MREERRERDEKHIVWIINI